MNSVALPWYTVGQTYVAHTVLGTIKIKQKSLAPWYISFQPKFGCGVFFGGQLVSWTPDLALAKGIATDFFTKRMSRGMI